MRRREFLASGLAASALAVAGRTGDSQAATGGKSRQYYELRKYLLRRDAQVQSTTKYLSEALVPALNRMGIGPVGAFTVDIGPETPTVYLLLPSENLETLVGAGLKLREDAAFLAAAEPFWNAPDTSPAFERVESTLLIAFEGWPRLATPPTTATKGKRTFQLRAMRARATAIMCGRWRCSTRGSLSCSRRRGSGGCFLAML